MNYFIYKYAPVAQSGTADNLCCGQIERWRPKPEVEGSNPSRSIFLFFTGIIIFINKQNKLKI